MATKPKRTTTPKRTATKTVKKFSFFRYLFSKALKYILFILCFLLGALVTNLDRLPAVYKSHLSLGASFLPSQVRRMVTTSEQGSFDNNIKEYTGKIVKVYDGDTATFVSDSDNKSYRLRFYGIDAPERAQTGGEASQQYLDERINGKEVNIKLVSTDRYGRGVANIYLDDEWINLTMVRQGWAWHYEAYAKGEHDLSAAMAEAKWNRRGIWKNGTNIQAPWAWRKSTSKNR